jgi:hypothetical protein
MKRGVFIFPIVLFLVCSCEQPAGSPSAEPEAPAYLAGIAALAWPDITVYAKGQPFDPAGLLVEGTWSGGEKRVLFPEEYSLDPVDTDLPGAKMVAIRAGEAEAYFPVMINDSTLILQNIRLDSPPRKTAYAFGEDISRAGMVVTGIYSDGSTRTESAWSFRGYDKTRRGKQTVTVTLNRKTAEFPVTVRVPAGATLTTNAYTNLNYNHDKTDYRDVYIRNQPFSVPAGLEVKVSANGSTAFFKENKGFEPGDFSGYNGAVPGKQSLTLRIDDAAVTVDIFVADVKPEVFFDYGYWRHGGDPQGTGPGGERYTVPLGRTLVLAPALYLVRDASYQWTVSGGSAPALDGEFLAFSPSGTGDSTITVQVRGKAIPGGEAVELSASTTVRCVAALPASPPASVPGFSGYKHFGPGQFTKGGSGYGWSLGGAGGYQIWPLRMANTGTPNISIVGNPMSNWSEPGVVWVMTDENGNGQPDDTWYELRGSDDDHSRYRDLITRRYAVTYFASITTVNKNGGVARGDRWVDSKGRSGAGVGSLPDNWGVTGDRVTYVLTLLRDNGMIATGEYGELMEFDWGYVDAAPGAGYADRAQQFNINEAIQRDGTAVYLPWIDFIKVQTGVFRYGGIFGEVSTEIVRATGLPDQSGGFPMPE